MNRREMLAGSGAVAAATILGGIPIAHAETPFAPSTPTEASRVVILPDVFRPEATVLVEDNAKTLVYGLMNRMDFAADRIEIADSGSETYRSWIADGSHHEDGIPPHIQFGGCVVAGKGDPTFHARWKERTRAKLASGELA